MALAIESAVGRDALASLSTDPLRFVLHYQEVATSEGNLYRFSEESVAYLKTLSERH